MIVAMIPRHNDFRSQFVPPPYRIRRHSLAGLLATLSQGDIVSALRDAHRHTMRRNPNLDASMLVHVYSFAMCDTAWEPLNY